MEFQWGETNYHFPKIISDLFFEFLFILILLNCVTFALLAVPRWDYFLQ